MYRGLLHSLIMINNRGGENPHPLLGINAITVFGWLASRRSFRSTHTVKGNTIIMGEVGSSGSLDKKSGKTICFVHSWIAYRNWV